MSATKFPYVKTVSVNAVGQKAVLGALFSHLYFCQSLYTLQRGLPATAGLFVIVG